MSKKKQTSLGDLGFTKTVLHRGKEIKTPLPYVEEAEKKLKCQHCEKGFVNQQGLSLHLKCVHSTGTIEKHTDENEDTTEKTNTEQETGPSSSTQCEKACRKPKCYCNS